MDAAHAMDLAREALKVTLVVGAPMLVAALVIALIVSLLQAATQIQDQALTFVPKLIAVAVTASLAGHWMLTRLVEFARAMFGTG
ncbi:MAG: flagellar biosynthesis protein FliQ [Planctomycetaceae bacterium]|nr:flagellar biosynthesis protein FliQ [Planctomycetaceae bacterium]